MDVAVDHAKTLAQACNVLPYQWDDDLDQLIEADGKGRVSAPTTTVVDLVLCAGLRQCEYAMAKTSARSKSTADPGADVIPWKQVQGRGGRRWCDRGGDTVTGQRTTGGYGCQEVGHIQRDCPHESGSTATGDACAYMAGAAHTSTLSEPDVGHVNGRVEGFKGSYSLGLDSGCSTHLSSVAADFEGLELGMLPGYPTEIRTTDGAELKIAGYADVEHWVLDESGKLFSFKLKTAFVPSAATGLRLMSVPVMEDKGVRLQWSGIREQRLVFPGGFATIVRRPQTKVRGFAAMYRLPTYVKEGSAALPREGSSRRMERQSNSGGLDLVMGHGCDETARKNGEACLGIVSNAMVSSIEDAEEVLLNGASLMASASSSGTDVDGTASSIVPPVELAGVDETVLYQPSCVEMTMQQSPEATVVATSLPQFICELTADTRVEYYGPWQAAELGSDDGLDDQRPMASLCDAEEVLTDASTDELGGRWQRVVAKEVLYPESPGFGADDNGDGQAVDDLLQMGSLVEYPGGSAGRGDADPSRYWCRAR